MKRNTWKEILPIQLSAWSKEFQQVCLFQGFFGEDVKTN